MSSRSVGIEEEFLLFRQDAAELVDAGPPVVAAAERATPEDAQFEKELKAAQTELATSPGTDLDRVAAELAERRAELAGAAAGRGARLVASGTSPVGDSSATTPNARYRDMGEIYGAIQARQLTCAMHVHVGVDGDEEAVRAVDGIAAWLPVLVALSANSPYHRGEDTSYASFRRIQWGQWPTAGPTAAFGSVAAYRRTVQTLIGSGAARDDGMIYFDARLSANYPTVEIRVCDVASEVATAVALAALCRGLVSTAALREVPPPPRLEVLRAAHWRAARYGMGGELLAADPSSDGRLVPAADACDALIAFCEQALDEAGDLARVREFVAGVVDRGTGADRQRAAVAAAGGDVAAALDATTVT